MCTVETLEVDERKEGAEPAEEIEEVQIGATTDNTTKIGASLPADLREKLVTFLRQNNDVFAWTPADMPSVPAEVITHQLKVNKTQRPPSRKKSVSSSRLGSSAKKSTRRGWPTS